MESDPTDVTALGHAIIRRREALRWTTHRLAQRAGVPDPFLRRIEDGKPKTVGVGTVARLARALGTTTDALLIESGLMEPPADWQADHPPLDVYLRDAHGLEPDDIDVVAHLVRRLSESATRYETEDEDEKTRQLRRAGESIEEYRTRTAGNPDAATDADRAAYTEEIPPAPDDHGPA